jgi:outer membrane protein TolC
MEETSILSEEERKELLSSLERAQARVKAGEAVQFDAAALRTRLLEIYRKGKREPQTPTSS